MRSTASSALLTLASLGTVLGAALGSSACSEPSASKGASAKKTASSVAPVGSGATAAHPAGALNDGGVAVDESKDAGAYDGPYAYGLFLATPIMSDMEWPIRPDQLKPGERQRSLRIGYIRQGTRVPVLPEPHKKSNCLEGWYELVTGGFVCGKYATLDPNHPKIRNAPHPPDLSGALPYSYGINLRNGTPMYKKLPSWHDRLRYEPWLVKPRPRPRDDDESTDAVVPAAMTTSSDVEDAGVPWYLRDYDGGKPDITLDDLREIDPTGSIEKRMIKGFYVSLDKDSKDFGAHWWKSIDGYYVPYERLYVPPMATSFHGVWLNQDPPADYYGTTVDAGLPTLPARRIDHLPVAFVLYKQRGYQPSDDGKKMVAGDWVQHFTVTTLTGQRKSVNRQSYLETDDGYWLREDLVVLTHPGPPPEGLLPGEKWIDVNLKNETLVAFEGDKPVYATLVTSGKRDLEHREKDHPTHNGEFRIREKHVAATMDADTASDGPYSIQDVPWIQYFNGSIALHGAFWHAEFGHTKSHGCVNLSSWDAKALFGWTEPQLPPGWHGVAATIDHPGTRVIVHDEAKAQYEDEDDEDAGTE